MVNEAIPSLKPRAIGEAASTTRGIALWGYIRMPDGWITIAPAEPLEASKRVARGQAYLKKYGQFQNDPFETDANGQRWNVRDEPFRMIFQKGGEIEFPVDQIVAFNWHLRPPYREVSFPQLEGIYWETYECPDCEKAIFTSMEPDTAPQDMIAHLRLGHGWSRAEVAEYAREVGINFKRTRKTHKPKDLGPKLMKELEDS